MADQDSSVQTQSESASKAQLAAAGLCINREVLASTAHAAVTAAADLGFPVVVKLCGDNIAHKTERGLVRLGLTDAAAVSHAAEELLAAARPEDGATGVLVGEMVQGNRELIVGVNVDDRFGPVIMLGVGGILAEAVGDVVFRMLPVAAADVENMLDDLTYQSLLGEFRGEAAVNRAAVVDAVLAVSAAAEEIDDLVSIDVNPLLIRSNGEPVAVDALIVTRPGADAERPPTRAQGPVRDLTPLFSPRGVVVAGVSSHPGKFGFVSLHNLLAAGYQGAVYGTSRSGESVLGVECFTSISDLPAGEVDLMFVCTPGPTVPGLLREAAAVGIRAAFVASAGFGEAGEDGVRAQAELAELADELGMVMAGPNGQGVVSTPVNLCAQIVAPFPPAGGISIVSQSGNLVSTFMNLAREWQVGVARAVSAGNAAALGPIDFLRWFGTDDQTHVALAYVEGIEDAPNFLAGLAEVTANTPVVVLKGGATEAGAAAAASHTGSLASDDRLVDGMLRQAGAFRADDVIEAFSMAAAFSAMPIPSGPRTVVLTSVGGWGVLAADAAHAHANIELMDLPEDLKAALDQKLPPRWSQANPIDMAGGETRDTIPEIIQLVAEHPDVDAIIYLGLGIQSNQARFMRNGAFADYEGVERMSRFHLAQDERYAQTMIEVMARSGTPVFVATELATGDRENPGPAALRAAGVPCFATVGAAVTALSALVEWGARPPNRHQTE